MVNDDGYEYTQNFDGIQKQQGTTTFFNMKCCVGKGGAQTKTLRDECHGFVEQQILVARKDPSLFFVNILEGDASFRAKPKFERLLNANPDVRSQVFVGTVDDYREWIVEWLR